MRLLIALSLIVFLALACNQQRPTPDLSGVRLITPSTSLDIAKGENAFLIENVSMPAKDISWSVSELPAWLDVYPSEGLLAQGEKHLVRFSFQPVSGPQSYEAEVELKLDNGFTKTIQIESDYQGCVAVPDTPETTIQPQALSLPNSSTLDQEILVKLKRSEEHKEILADYANQGLVLLKKGYGTQVDIFYTLGNRQVLIAALNQDSRVAYAEANATLELLASEGDPISFTTSTDTTNVTAPTTQWQFQDFGVAEGWARIDVEAQLKQKPVIVAVIDSGFDIDHEDLAINLVPGCDFFGQFGKDNEPGLLNISKTNRDYYHGTHVTGIVAAVTNNTIGISGLSNLSNVRVQPIKIFGKDGNRGVTTIDLAADAMRWAAGLDVEGMLPNPTPADIINFSVGRPEPSDVLEEAVNDIVAAGKIFVASSGNRLGGNGIMYPSALPNAISVGSIDSTLTHSSFSRYNEVGRIIDVVAPGGNGTSSHAGSSCSGILSTIPENQYDCSIGTSMASPYVSGVLAMIWAKYPEWTSEQVKERLFASSFFDTSWQFEATKYGRGVPCLDKALGASTWCGTN